MTDKPTDPTDKLAADTFVSHRAGYDPKRLATLRAMIHAIPGRTLAGGDGAVLLQALEEREHALMAIGQMSDTVRLHVPIVLQAVIDRSTGLGLLL